MTRKQCNSYVAELTDQLGDLKNVSSILTDQMGILERQLELVHKRLEVLDSPTGRGKKLGRPKKTKKEEEKG